MVVSNDSKLFFRDNKTTATNTIKKDKLHFHSFYKSSLQARQIPNRGLTRTMILLFVKYQYQDKFNTQL